MTRDQAINHIMTMLPYAHTEGTRKILAEATVDVFLNMRIQTIELCAAVAEHQKTICGLSMSRQSTCDDIAQNIRKLNAD